MFSLIVLYCCFISNEVFFHSASTFCLTLSPSCYSLHPLLIVAFSHLSPQPFFCLWVSTVSCLLLKPHSTTRFSKCRSVFRHPVSVCSYFSSPKYVSWWKRCGQQLTMSQLGQTVDWGSLLRGWQKVSVTAYPSLLIGTVSLHDNNVVGSS